MCRVIHISPSKRNGINSFGEILRYVGTKKRPFSSSARLPSTCKSSQSSLYGTNKIFLPSRINKILFTPFRLDLSKSSFGIVIRLSSTSNPPFLGLFTLLYQKNKSFSNYVNLSC